ncbi:sulfatase-like hydrolase/transferase [Caldilinea sp.]|uniref:sulfatase-like hydrolase/transferase n=1 Tax=Caldilinea sp. TaxID=2293560 RepID=UPI002C8872CD|nr:sulfatase-like hydrolase/transferase [Caldilinea sp.]HRA66079.1 sulfatase-like hydrolase/transferase [Caldilinea sp.]
MNFIFFMPDELRAESVGCYGHPLVQTPNLDALAAQGTRFDQCHVQHTVCTPSRCSMMTGWYPHVGGHRTLWHLLRPHEPNLLRCLKQAGYDVRWYGKNDLLAPGSFAESVTEARTLGGKAFGPPAYAQDDPRRFSFLCEPYRAPLEQHTDYANVMAGIDFLRSRPQQPFLLYLPLIFPHPPYSAPEPWHSQVDPSAIDDLRPADLPNRPAYHRLIRQTRGLDLLEPMDFQRINAVYLGMTSFIDHLLGLLLDALAGSGLEEETAVFFFSDHGDWAGDYDLVEKWPSALEDALTRVPLVVRLPGGASGHGVQEPVELLDIFATVLGLAGVEAQHTHFGRNLTPQLHGATGDPTRIVYAEGGYARHEPHCFEGDTRRDQFARDPNHLYYPKGYVQQEHPLSVARATMVRSAGAKLIYRATGESELYDLSADPRELDNLYGQPQADALQRELERKLLNWLTETSDVTPFAEDPRGFSTPVP